VKGTPTGLEVEPTEDVASWRDSSASNALSSSVDVLAKNPFEVNFPRSKLLSLVDLLTVDQHTHYLRIARRRSIQGVSMHEPSLCRKKQQEFPCKSRKGECFEPLQVGATLGASQKKSFHRTTQHNTTQHNTAQPSNILPTRSFRFIKRVLCLIAVIVAAQVQVARFTPRNPAAQCSGQKAGL
jgi:hypothetical protein